MRSPAAAVTVARDERSPEIQRLHDELVACKLREAEAHLSMKEFEQKLLQLQRHWQVSTDHCPPCFSYTSLARLQCNNVTYVWAPSHMTPRLPR